MDIEALTNDAGLIVRSVAIRATETERREFTGIGVPYGEIYDTGYGYREQWDKGSVTGGDEAKIYWRHGEVIGKVQKGKDTAAGYEITAKISDTALGRDAYTLLRDGAVDSLSIGFKPLEYRETEDGVIVITKAVAREFSLVPNPAYTDAKVSAVRSEAPPREKGHATVETEEIARQIREGVAEQTAPVLEGQQELERRMATLTAGTTDGPSVPEYRSIGEYVRAVANGEDDALELHRAFAGGTLADAIVKDSWIGEYIKLVADRRRIFNTFGNGTLPATGMNVEYGKLKSNTTAVGEQANEGDDLTGPGKVELDIDTAKVYTDGGWSELSVQAIQRATVPVLNTLWKALMLKYAAATEARARTAYFALMDGHLAADPVASPDAALSISDAAGTSDWLDLIVDAALIYEERGHALEGLHASADQFKALNRITDGSGRRLMKVYGEGVNQVGELNLKTVSGNLANLPVNLIGGRATTGRLSFYDSVALETLESPGAPIQLQDENIVNLSKQMSLYGHTAVTTPFPDAVLPIEITPAA